MKKPINRPEDIGKFLVETGMAVKRATPSDHGAHAGRQGHHRQAEACLRRFGDAHERRKTGVETRGKAKVGDRTLIDALRRASNALGCEPVLADGDGRDRRRQGKCDPHRNKHHNRKRPH